MGHSPGKVFEEEFEGSLLTLPREDEELAEKRGALRFGSLNPCWDLVGVSDVIKCLLEGSLVPSFHIPGEHPTCWVTDLLFHFLLCIISIPNYMWEQSEINPSSETVGGPLQDNV